MGNYKYGIHTSSNSTWSDSGFNVSPSAYARQLEYELHKFREETRKNAEMETLREQYLRGSWYEGVPSQAPAKKELTCPSCNEPHDSGYWGINNSGRCSRMAKKFNDKIRKLYWHRIRKEIE